MKRSGKRFRLAALLTAVSLMTGCTASTLETPEEALPTLAPAAVGWTAPDGDRMEGDEGLWTLYLPGKNGLNLVAQHIPGTPGLLRTERLEQMCRELLSFQANSQVDALRTESPLELAGTNPVEFSSGVATVNLSSPALGLSYRQFYIMSLALAATLSLLTYYIHGIFNNFLDTDKLSVPFWGLTAVVVALDVFSEKKPETPVNHQKGENRLS